MNRSVAIFLCLFALPAVGSPCTGIDRALPKPMKSAFAPAIEKHLNLKLGASVGEKIATRPEDVLKVFRERNWHIVYVNTNVSDEPFLFYSSPPHRSTGYIEAWSGAARMSDGPAIRKWVVANVPGIPSKLADCFAWHVTQVRDK